MVGGAHPTGSCYDASVESSRVGIAHRGAAPGERCPPYRVIGNLPLRSFALSINRMVGGAHPTGSCYDASVESSRVGIAHRGAAPGERCPPYRVIGNLPLRSFALSINSRMVGGAHPTGSCYDASVQSSRVGIAHRGADPGERCPPYRVFGNLPLRSFALSINRMVGGAHPTGSCYDASVQSSRVGIAHRGAACHSVPSRSP
jgi:hypothetical protein